MINRYNPLTKKDEKCTPNQKAKELVLDVLEIAEYLEEKDPSGVADMTEKEKQDIYKYLSKQIQRVYGTLSPEFYDKK